MVLIVPFFRIALHPCLFRVFIRGRFVSLFVCPHASLCRLRSDLAHCSLAAHLLYGPTVVLLTMVPLLGCWDVKGIVGTVERDGMNLTQSIATHYHW
jgi:hypothetical protein